jgi:hypothetical protein
MNIENVKRGVKLIQDGIGVLSAGPLEYYLRKLIECQELLVTKYAPFKVGDRVILTKTPDINSKDSWGWMGSKHFLVKGAHGTVRSVDVDGRGFSASVEFDDESWIAPDGCINPIKDKHVFGFHEDYLVRATAT